MLMIWGGLTLDVTVVQKTAPQILIYWQLRDLGFQMGMRVRLYVQLPELQ